MRARTRAVVVAIDAAAPRRVCCRRPGRRATSSLNVSPCTKFYSTCRGSAGRLRRPLWRLKTADDERLGAAATSLMCRSARAAAHGCPQRGDGTCRCLMTVDARVAGAWRRIRDLGARSGAPRSAARPASGSSRLRRPNRASAVPRLATTRPAARPRSWTRVRRDPVRLSVLRATIRTRASAAGAVLRARVPGDAHGLRRDLARTTTSSGAAIWRGPAGIPSRLRDALPDAFRATSASSRESSSAPRAR